MTKLQRAAFGLIAGTLCIAVGVGGIYGIGYGFIAIGIGALTFAFFSYLT